MLRCDKAVFDRFQRAAVTDFWLPINEATLTKLGVPIDAGFFLQFQQYLLSDPVYMDNGTLLETTQFHRHLDSGDVYFQELDHINDGASSSVYRIQHRASGKVFACKRAFRGAVRQQQGRLQLFLSELEILRRLSHHHIVRLVVSYTDMTTFNLVLHPVADESLRSMLNRSLSATDMSVLRQSFGCLISALEYLHNERHIRHKDIKPDNILLNDGRIYLCDFGISHDWSEIGEATTDGRPFQRTIGYCAPEVIDWHSRNNAADIWSMGRVFCDIVTVINGRSLSQMLKYLGGDLSRIYTDLDAMIDWLKGLETRDEHPSDALTLAWTQDMVCSAYVRRLVKLYLRPVDCKTTERAARREHSEG